MNAADIAPTLRLLFDELTLGAPEGAAFVLNGGDAGLLGSLDALDSHSASTSSQGGATIAAHVAHVTYGLSLMNRWALGEENPFASADWSTAWRTSSVNDQEWSELRRSLRREIELWHPTLGTPRDLVEIELHGMVASVVHLAYHLGAMRQISAQLRGPKDPGPDRQA